MSPELQYFDAETGLYYNYFRSYDPKIGAYPQSDPIGLMAGMNTFGYADGNPVSWFDFFGLEKIVTISEGGTIDGTTYGATVTVTDDSTGDKLFSGKGSSFSNNKKKWKTIDQGTYTAPVEMMATKNKVGLLLGNNISATKNSDGSGTTASGVFVHCGYSDTNRGSQACPTIQKDQCKDFFSNFSMHENVSVIIKR